MEMLQRAYRPVVDLLEEHGATSKKGAYVTEPSIKKYFESRRSTIYSIRKAHRLGKIINIGPSLPDMKNSWTLNEDELSYIGSVEPFFQSSLSEGYSIDNRIKSPRLSYQALKDAINERLSWKVIDLKNEVFYGPMKKQQANYIHGNYLYDKRNVDMNDDGSKKYSSLISTLEMLMSHPRGIYPPSRKKINDMDIECVPNVWKEIVF